jgi:hypothetical protein
LTSDVCPPFLEPRLRLFLSADIVGSTSLKQTRARPAGSADDSTKGPVWFSAIQGFYFEAAQAFLYEWNSRKKESELPQELYGDEPLFWKSIGDEVLFTKVLSDHRQLATTLNCWFSAVSRMRKFLKNENSSLDVKCTAWLAGFPYRNREVVIGKYPNSENRQIENYYQENGNLLNKFYNEQSDPGLAVDYIGPSIDTGFRLTSFSSSRKMVVSIDIAYIISMTSFDGEVKRLDLYYEGSHSLKGVMGGAPYPVFWINMSGENSLAVKEDRLKLQNISNREDLKEYCDAFYQEYSSFTFRPFIKDDVGQTMAKAPSWYTEYHALLVKNFNLPDNEYQEEVVNSPEDLPNIDDKQFEEVAAQISLSPSNDRGPQLSVGDAVSHKKFGTGTVVKIDGMRISVQFDNAGLRIIAGSFLQLIAH